jgi:glycolate oxidase
MTSEVLERLRERLGDRVTTDPEVLETLRTDRSGTLAAGIPLALVDARSIDDVRETCRIASATGTPIVPRGAGSGLAGAAAAGVGEIVLSTASMRRILEVRADDQLCVVEPGILNGELNAELARHGLWWPPDPASKDFSSVGGNIAMNAGGLLCAKYGVTREAVLALKVVLASGELIEVGHRTVKGVTGYDL